MSYQNVGEVERDEEEEEDKEEELERQEGDLFDDPVYLCSRACRSLFEIESNYWEMVRVCWVHFPLKSNFLISWTIFV